MFLKEKKQIEDLLNKKASQKEEIVDQIKCQKEICDDIQHIVDKYISVKKGKKLLKGLIKIYFCFSVVVMFLCFLFNIIPRENLIWLFGASFIYIGYFCIEPITNIYKAKSIKESDYKEAVKNLELSEEKIISLEKELSFVEEEIKKGEDLLEDINKLPIIINHVLSISKEKQPLCSPDQFIKEKLLEEYVDYLNEPIDYSKVFIGPEMKINKVVLKLKK